MAWSVSSRSGQGMCTLFGSWVLVLTLMVGASVAGHAQRRAWNWYFGDQAGVTFRNGIPEPLDDGVIATEEGCAAISNPANGDLLFYTDGVTVWDRDHSPMPNGMGLNGDASTSQSAMIVPIPGSTDRYVIVNPAPITSADPGSKCLCLMYSVVDMSLRGGLGDVIEKNTLLDDDVTEHLAATADCNEGGWWVIARRRSSPEFVSYHLTATGFDPAPTVSPAASLPGIRDVGQMHTSPDGRHLVITSQSGEAHLYSILRTTGLIHSGISLFDGESIGSAYGAAFTRDSRAVLIGSSVIGSQPGTLVYRFLLNSSKADSIRATREYLGSLPGSAKFAGMQLASDAHVYIARPDQQVLARVTNPSGVSPLLEDSVVAFAGTCRSGLPKFVGWIMGPHPPGDSSCLFPQVAVDDTTICISDCYAPIARVAGDVDFWSWSVPGAVPPASDQEDPTFCFPTVGSFTGTLIVTNASGSDTTSFTITVRPGPTISLAEQARMCKGSFVSLVASGADAYRWVPTDGLTDPTSESPIATPDTTTTYTVYGTDAFGCVDSASITVTVIDLRAGPDETICLGASARLTADSADSYRWEPASTLDDPAQRSPLATPTETTVYTVTMTLGNCTSTDTVVVTVGSSLSIEIQGPTEACNGDRVLVRVVGGSGSYAWSGSGVEPSDSASTFVTVSGPTQVIVEANSGDCIARDTLDIVIGGGPSLSVPNDTSICRGESAFLTVQTNGTEVTWQPAAGLNTDRGTAVIATPAQTTSYIVTAADGSTCISVDTIVVVVRNTPVIDAGPDKGFCIGGAVQISAIGSADSFVWSPGAGLNDSTSIAPIASPNQTTEYIVTAERDGCVITDTVLIEVSDMQIQVSGPRVVCIGETVELMASGAATYQWSPVDGLSDPNVANPLASPRVTTTYRVTGVDRFGCVDTQMVTIEVLDTLGLTIEAGEVQAEAGETNVGIPIYVNVDAGQLPVRIDQLRAAIVHDAGSFLPDSAERGQIVTSIRGTERVTYLVMRDIQVVTARQRITMLRGTALLGTMDVVPLAWEDVTWSGLTCPREEAIPGRLLITGCNLRKRVLHMFDRSVVHIRPRPGDNVIEVRIEGSEPGNYDIQLITTDGRCVTRSSAVRPFGDEIPMETLIDMSSVAGGLYHVVVRTPSGPVISRVAWLP